ncbi:MAG TPA: serine/threonine-protein kinase [Polyangiaceae bacterium]|nr:serine/threonine-protein kinase [Polyangiaceae bacterium]
MSTSQDDFTQPSVGTSNMAMGSELKEKAPERVIGRYAIYDEIASGGMAVVHLGRMMGQAGFSRTVAIKRLHPQFAKDPNFVGMFLDEARLAVRVQHPNVVAPLDVLVVDGEVLVVMEYVAGDTLSRLQRSPATQVQPPSPAVVVSVLSNALHGLHAAHEALSEDGRPLHIVHRDVSPQNIMVGTNGIARVLDFGVAKAAIRSQSTTNGEVRGKLAYMAPEQLEGGALDSRTDVFAAGIVIWELLSQHRLFNPDQPGESMSRIVRGRVPSIRTYRSQISAELDRVVLKALQRDPNQRHQTARDFAVALEQACAPASPSAVADWVKAVGGEVIAARAERVAAIETHSSSSMIRPLPPPPRSSGMVPVQVPPLPIDPDGLAGRSLSRITIPLVSAARPDPVRVRETPANTLAAGTSPAPVSRHVWTLRSTTILALGACLVLAGALLTILVPRWISMSGAASPGSSAAAPGKSAAPSSPDTARAQLTPPAPSIAAVGQGQPTVANETGAETATEATADASSNPAAEQKSATRKQRSARGTSTSANALPRPSTVDAPKTKPSCSPPYFVDAKGIRRLRPECL